jgi:hypothetical protein
MLTSRPLLLLVLLLLVLLCLCCCGVLQLPDTPPTSKKAQGGAPQADDDEVQRCCLALVLFWARWRQGEPVIVRGCEVRGFVGDRFLFVATGGGGDPTG